MAFITIDMTGVAEPKPVSPGRYPLIISTAKYREDKPDIEVSIGIEGHTDAPNIRHFISLPKKVDDESKIAFKKLMLKRFLSQFKIPTDGDGGFNTDDFPGATALAQITLSEPDPETSAVYNRLQLDRMSGEPSGSRVQTANRKPPKR